MSSLKIKAGDVLLGLSIGFLTYKKSSQLIFLSIYLIFLSIVLEVLQYFVPNRSFEFSDLFGNLAGAIIAIILFYFLKKQ